VKLSFFVNKKSQFINPSVVEPLTEDGLGEDVLKNETRSIAIYGY